MGISAEKSRLSGQSLGCPGWAKVRVRLYVRAVRAKVLGVRVGGTKMTPLREASPPDALTASRRTQRLDHAASLVPLPAPSVGPAEGELPTPQTVPRLQVVWGSQLPEASNQGPHLLMPGMGSNPQYHHQMRMQLASDLHLANIAGLAAASEAVAGAGALPRLNLRFSRLLRLALNLKAKRTTTSLAAQRRCDALQLPRRASAQDSPLWTPLLWKKSCASACSRFKASLLVSGERSALPSARPWRSFRTDTPPAGAPRMEAVPPRAAHASVPCRQGVTHPAK